MQNILDNTKLEGRQSAAALAALVGLTLSYVLHYPGYLAYDSLRFLAEGRQLTFLSQHQPFVGFVWHFLDRLVEGAPLMLLFQMAPFWFAVYLLLHHLKVAWPLAIAAVLLLIFWPTLLLLSGVIFKDTIASNFIILAFVLLLERPAGKRMLLRWGLSGAALGIACLCRYQYAVVLLPILAGLMLQRPDAGGSSPRKFPLGSSLVASFLVTIVGVNSLIASVSTVSTDNLGANLQRLIIYDLAGIAVREPDVEFKVLNSAGIDTDKVKRMLLENYQAQRVDPIIYDALGVRDNGQRYIQILPGADLRLLTQQWMAVAPHHPMAWLRHHMASFSYLLNIHQPYECWTHYPPVSVDPPEVVSQLGLSPRSEPLSLPLTEIKRWPSAVAPFLRHWVSILGCVFALAGLAAASPRRPALLGLGIASLLFVPTFFFFNMACDARYLYLLSATTPFLLVALVLLRKSPVAATSSRIRQVAENNAHSHDLA